MPHRQVCYTANILQNIIIINHSTTNPINSSYISCQTHLCCGCIVKAFLLAKHWNERQLWDADAWPSRQLWDALSNMENKMKIRTLFVCVQFVSGYIFSTWVSKMKEKSQGLDWNAKAVTYLDTTGFLCGFIYWATWELRLRVCILFAVL